MKKIAVLFFIALMIGFSGLVEAKPKWISLLMVKTSPVILQFRGIIRV